jgi:hypothetical protein
MKTRHVVPGPVLALLLAGAAPLAADQTEAARQAEALVKRAEEASQREFAPAFRRTVLDALSALAAEELRSREERGAEAGLGPLVIGDSSAQLVYTPVQPCRIIDTRAAGAGGSLQPGTVRNFKVTGTGLQGQGGASAGCNVPFGPATAAVINFVAVNPSGAGNLRAWAYSTPTVPAPNASVINYTPVSGATLNLANGVVVPLCDSLTTSCPSLDIRVQADTSATQLVADVLGYFERFPKEQARSFAVVDASATSTAIGTNCTHVNSADVQVNVPVAGRVVVRAMATLFINQTAGASSSTRTMVLGITQSANDCNFSNFAHAMVRDQDITDTFLFTVPVTATFTVTPGTFNYFLNAFMDDGPANSGTVVPGTFVEATFYPN